MYIDSSAKENEYIQLCRLFYEMVYALLSDQHLPTVSCATICQYVACQKIMIVMDVEFGPIGRRLV